MGESTGIQWTDHTFNPWMGCEKVSAECDHCYAERDSKRFAVAHGLKLWEGDRHVTSEAYWRGPLRWDRKAAQAATRQRVFCASFADVFEDREDLVAPRARLFALIDQTPNLDWLLLTKRPENIWGMLPAAVGRRVPDIRANVWLGTTVGANASLPRIRALLSVPAAIHFVSYEPALEYVDFAPYVNARCGASLDWLIVGGESGAKARPFDLDWARDAVEACRKGGCAPFVKQLGAVPIMNADAWRSYPFGFLSVKNRERAPAGHVPIELRDSHGGDPSEWPADLRVRDFPRLAAQKRIEASP